MEIQLHSGLVEVVTVRVVIMVMEKVEKVLSLKLEDLAKEAEQMVEVVEEVMKAAEEAAEVDKEMVPLAVVVVEEEVMKVDMVVVPLV